MSSKLVDGVTTTYGYDDADQLISEARPGYSAGYTYDGNGNRLSKTLNGVTEAYAYDNGDKLLSAGTKTYTYDLAGRTKSVTSPAGITNLSYDDESRLTQVSGVGGNQTYTYNGMDARRTKTNGGTTSTYKRMGVSPTSPVISDGQASYTPGISERRSGSSKWTHSDYLGSTKALTNSSESVTDTRKYDAFGMLDTAGSSGSNPIPFGFAGGFGYQSDETGLQLLGHRYYDPSTGRFLTRDPIKDGRNWYTYCENNPINYADPTGLLAWFIPVFLIGALIGGSVTNAEAPMEYAPPSLPPSIGQRILGATVVGVGAVALAGAVKPLLQETVKQNVKKELSKEAKKGIRSLQRELDKHRDKLRKYRENPYKYDNKGVLRNAPKERHQKIIEGRIKKLERDIKTFEGEIKKLEGS